jgi:ATP-dependent DNA ligase
VAAPDIQPMLATTGVPRSLEGWTAEPKLDGWRARVLVDPELAHGISVRTRSGRDITQTVPQVQGLVGAGLRVVLDGELVADAGRLADFYRLGPALARRRNRPVPVAFVAFDLLWHDGDLMTRLPLRKRRDLLDQLDLPTMGEPTAPTYSWEEAPELFKACDEHGVEGIVLKRSRPSTCPGGARSPGARSRCRLGPSTGGGGCRGNDPCLRCKPLSTHEPVA